MSEPFVSDEQIEEAEAIMKAALRGECLLEAMSEIYA